MRIPSIFTTILFLLGVGHSINATAGNLEFCTARPDIKKQKINAYEQKKDVLSQSTLMAVFSAISYNDDGMGDYKLPEGWVRDRSFSDRSGLFAVVFKNESRKELVIAFRGTEFKSTKDWAHNLLPLVKAQSQPAQHVVEQEISNSELKNWNVTLTGHSLGGGLAIEVSHKVKGVSAVAFNPSPRVGVVRNGYGNRRIVIREKYEPLATVRWNPRWRKDWALRHEALVDFTPGFFLVRAFSQHGIDSMAMNLLALSATWSPDALALHNSICNAQQLIPGDVTAKLGSS